MSNQPTPARTGAIRSRLVIGATFGLRPNSSVSEAHHTRLEKAGYYVTIPNVHNAVYMHGEHGHIYNFHKGGKATHTDHRGPNNKTSMTHDEAVSHAEKATAGTKKFSDKGSPAGAKFGLLDEHQAHARLGEYGYKHVRTSGRHSIYEHAKDGFAVVDNHNGHIHIHHPQGHMEYTANEVKEGWRKS
jgi:predicted RNA binding protein YcfA (HicA-like mRNA interferase family)